MRVVAGQYKGRQLKAPQGRTTRPTQDRVKESLMSKIISAQGSFDGVRVLDAFAGSGALGIEALSRGADFVLFCDNSFDAQKTIEANLALLSIAQEHAQVYKTDVFQLASRSFSQPFDLVFLDPPYAMRPLDVLGIMDTFYVAQILSPDVLLCYELAKTAKPELLEALNTLKWASVSLKDYGETTLALLRKDAL